MPVEQRTLKILIHGLNFSPELTGIGKYTGEMALWLAQRGHAVHVVTTPPYYPAWRLGAGFQNRYTTEHPLPNLTVHRCPLYIPRTPSGLKRMLHLSSFAVASVPVVLREIGWTPDVILGVEPTFFAAPLTLLVASASGAASWLHVQDFEIDAAFDLGLLPSGGWLERSALHLERWFTRAFDRVSSISPRMVDRAVRKGVAPGRTVLFPNWVDHRSIVPQRRGTPNSFRQQLGLREEIVFLYSGNMGNKQGLECLAPLASALGYLAQVRFVFCGDGAFRPELERQVTGLGNVILLPLQPPERLNDLLNLADVHLLPQKANVADLVMPSKLTGMLASGRPVLAMAICGTQVAEVVGGGSVLSRHAGAEARPPCGVVVAPGDLDTLCAAASELASNSALRDRLGAAARSYAVQHLGQEEVLARLEHELVHLRK